MEKIDIVVLWVDGSDPAWQAEKSRYSGSDGDQSANRYRDWDILKYWFRGVETYAPWVNKVHFVTWGHLPPWLNTECEKLHIVKHEDFIPGEYLPTFSSHPIELNLHRIEGLAEKFVYFNDDTFIINPVAEEDFFRDGLPCDIAALYPGYVGDGAFEHILLNDAQFFTRHFSIKQILKEDKKKWFNLSYGKHLLKTLFMTAFPDFPGIVLHHQPQSYLKETLREVWEAEKEVLDVTCKNRFRNSADVNQYVFRYWQLGKGKFYPYNVFKRGQYVTVGEMPQDYENLILNSGDKLLCLNDVSLKVDFETEQKRMQEVFEKKFPQKSHYEL